MHYSLIVMLLFASICCTYTVLAEMRSCTIEESKAAEDLPSAGSWEQLEQQFKQYAHCDDGAIGEGFSESVSLLLAEHWEDSKQLGVILKADVNFHKFILRHIDATVPSERLEHIVNNAQLCCPVNMENICNDIEKIASQAIKEF